MEYISLSECKNGCVYRLKARSFSIGIYNSSTQHFSGIRNKCNEVFVDTEYHWDNFGTATPLEEIKDPSILRKFYTDIADIVHCKLNYIGIGNKNLADAAIALAGLTNSYIERDSEHWFSLTFLTGDRFLIYVR